MNQPVSGKSTEPSPTTLFQSFAAGLWNLEGNKKKLPRAPPLSDAPQLAKLSELISSSSSHRPTSGTPTPNGFATEPDFRAGVTSDEEASTSAPSVTRTRRHPFRRKSAVKKEFLTPQEQDKYNAFGATEHSLKQQIGRRGSFDQQQSSSAAVTKPWTEQPSVLGGSAHPTAAWDQLVAQQKEGLRRSLSAARQTFANCHDNFQSLGGLVQKGLRFRGLPAVQAPSIGSQPAGSENVTFTTHPSALGSLPFSDQGIQLFPGGQLALVDGNADLLPCYVKLKARDMALLEAALAELTKERRFGSRGAGQTTDAPGPLQMLTAKRRRRHKNSSLREEGRQVAIVTTASLPWMTGTAVNPLLRAAYLARDKTRKVTLVIPWLAKGDQKTIFPHNITFEHPEQQEEYVRSWVRKRTNLACDFSIRFYQGRYAAEKGSILPVGDPTAYVPKEEADIAVLEEPEHLCWYHHGERWTDKFKHVVGIIHTNYLDYARREKDGKSKEKLLLLVNQLVCRIHCDKVIKLSDAVQPLPRQITRFVHGVPDSFLQVGAKKAEVPEEPDQPRFSRGAYFMGKAVWAKGYTELLDLFESHNKRGEPPVALDCYGNGEDLPEIQRQSDQRHLGMKMLGAKDHLDESMHEYKVFLNPSMSDVVATTTAEALAMGKWVIVHEHPSNKFFATFPNCLTYRSPKEFSNHLKHALGHDPKPMTPAERQRLTWEDATERFLDAAALTDKDQPGPLDDTLDRLAWFTHNTLTGVEPLRHIAGAGVHTRDNPISFEAYNPSDDDGCGLFDDRRRITAKPKK